MFEWLKSDKRVQKYYIESGCYFGDAVSYIYMGECIGFADLLADWAKWELEYAKRGYRTFSIDDFIELGGYGQPIKDVGIKRAQGEDAVYHAETYRQVYLGKMPPTVNIQKIMERTCIFFIIYLWITET